MKKWFYKHIVTFHIVYSINIQNGELVYFIDTATTYKDVFCLFGKRYEERKEIEIHFGSDEAERRFREIIDLNDSTIYSGWLETEISIKLKPMRI